MECEVCMCPEKVEQRRNEASFTLISMVEKESAHKGFISPMRRNRWRLRKSNRWDRHKETRATTRRHTR